MSPKEGIDQRGVYQVNLVLLFILGVGSKMPASSFSACDPEDDKLLDNQRSALCVCVVL